MLHGIFQLLALGEFTCPPPAATSTHVLSVSDFGVDSLSNPSFVSVHLHHSKMEMFSVGATVYLGRVEGPVCPVKAILAHLAL